MIPSEAGPLQGPSHPGPTFPPTPAPRLMLWAFCWSILVSLLSVGCLEPTSATPYPGMHQAEFQVVATSVEQGAEQQPVDQALTISFSDRVAPSSLTTSNIVLSEEGHAPPRLRLRQDLARCTVTVEPREDLAPGALYRLTVSTDLLSWSGKRLGEDSSLSFTTGQGRIGAIPRSPISSHMVQQRIFDHHCGCCHAPDQGTYSQVLALDAASVVNQPSRQRPGMVLVSPGSHDESYLLHKILGLPGIDGEPMPPEGMSCEEPWPTHRFCGQADEDLQLLADWIFDLATKRKDSTP